MRQILFRGKRVDNGEWVEGNLVWLKNIEDQPYQFFIISQLSYFEYGEFDEMYQVFPETLGQFTGLTDKNGKRIWDGDIVRVKGLESDENWKCYDEIGKVAFVDGAFLIEVPKEFNGVKYYSKIHSYYMTTVDWVTREVVGNHFDNPELLTAERIDNENQ